MHPMLLKTFGGLTLSYYFRHFVFGLIFPTIFVMMAMSAKSGQMLTIPSVFFIVISTFLYPYSRFVYEGIIGFILGNNVFWANAWFVLLTKVLTMALCWTCAIFISPIGLAYLYYYHSKAAVS